MFSAYGLAGYGTLSPICPLALVISLGYWVCLFMAGEVCIDLAMALVRYLWFVSTSCRSAL